MTRPSSPAKPTNSASTSGNPKEQGSEKTTSLDQARSRVSRAPQKPPRTKRLSVADREANLRAKPGDFQSVESMSDAGKPPEKLPVRRYSTKGMMRSKSVDFNFNSSSTDGSVLDYDNALIQAERQTVTAEAKAQLRRSHISAKDAKLPLSQPASLKNIPSNERVYSDSSEMESKHHGNRLCNEKSKYNLEDQNYKRRRSIPNSETIELEHARVHVPMTQDHDKLTRSQQPLQQKKTKPVPLDQDLISQSSNERFIRITFTPQQTTSSRKLAFRFGSEDLLEPNRSGGSVLEEELGSDFSSGADLYDSVVKRIKEISSSDLNSFEKLKQVTELLSLGTLEEDGNPKPMTSTLKASKTSFSTLDLRSKNSLQHDDDDMDENRKFSDSKNESFSLKRRLDKSETPVEVVQRMKKNLAKSMEELNVTTSYPQNKQRAALSSEENFTALSDNKKGKMYRSEIRIQPLYSKAHEVAKEIADAKMNSQRCSMSDTEAPKYMLLPRNQGHSGSQTRPNVGPMIQDCSGSESSQNPVSCSQRWSGSYLSSPSERSSDKSAKAIVSKFIPENSVVDHHILDTFVPSESRRHSVTKPASLNLFSKRNFISPSFLRPASSMNDISTKVCPPPTFKIDVDFDDDYQALEDLEMLQTLQEDVLSSEFSKYMSKTQRKPSNDNVVEESKDEPGKFEGLHQTEIHFQALPLEKDSQDAAVHGSNSVPEIMVGYITDQWLNLDEHEEHGLPYIPGSDIDFDR